MDGATAAPEKPQRKGLAVRSHRLFRPPPFRPGIVKPVCYIRVCQLKVLGRCSGTRGPPFRFLICARHHRSAPAGEESTHGTRSIRTLARPAQPLSSCYSRPAGAQGPQARKPEQPRAVRLLTRRAQLRLPSHSVLARTSHRAQPGCWLVVMRLVHSAPLQQRQ